MCERLCVAYEAGECRPQDKDGALAIISSIAKLLDQAGGRDRLLLFARRHILSDLKSGHAYLRGRACTTIGNLAPYIENEQDILNQALSGIVQLLHDPELPVSFQASISIRSLIFDEFASAPRALAATSLAPVLPEVLTEMFRLMDIVGSDELLTCLEKLIETFASSMAPFASSMAMRISDHFLRLVADSGETSQGNDEDEFEAIFAASQCLSALVSLTRAMKGNKEMHLMMQQLLCPLLMKMLPAAACDEDEEDGSLVGRELADDVLELARVVTDAPNGLDPSTLQILMPVLSLGIDGDGEPDLAQLTPTVRNILRNAGASISGDPKHVTCIYELIERTLLEGADAQEGDYQQACMLGQELLLCCRGAADQTVPMFLKHIQEMALSDEITTPCKKEVMKLLCACLEYDPSLTFASADSSGSIFAIMNEICSRISFDERGQANLKDFKTLRDLKVLHSLSTALPLSLSPSLSLSISLSAHARKHTRNLEISYCEFHVVAFALSSVAYILIPKKNLRPTLPLPGGSSRTALSCSNGTAIDAALLA